MTCKGAPCSGTASMLEADNGLLSPWRQRFNWDVVCLYISRRNQGSRASQVPKNKASLIARIRATAQNAVVGPVTGFPALRNSSGTIPEA
ncbi:hypothetical protein TWF281_000049 [Arthrobotrys megalospora]